MDSNLSSALLIFAKWPAPGAVKTRLSPPLTADEAANLYRCMFLDTMAATASLTGITRILCYDGVNVEKQFRELAPDVHIARQQGEGLGERMQSAFGEAFDKGFSAIAVIGTDAPHLATTQIDAAFNRLAEGDTDLVFGPSDDGGYYLLAMKQQHPELFREIPWSSATVLEKSLARAAAAGLRTALLPGGFDLDTVDELHRFMALPDRDAAPLTRKYLNCLGF